jgi:antitoxin component of MazEF toxin-antitoxin module
MPITKIGRIRKAGNSYAVTIPAEVVRDLGLVNGELVGFTVEKLDIRPALAPEIKAILDRNRERDAAAHRLLAEN